MNLKFAGDEVTSVRFDYAVSFTTLGGFEVRMGTAIDLEMIDGRRVSVDPEIVVPESVLILSALHQRVVSCVADDSGALVVEVGNLAIRVAPDNLYEAWTVAGPNGYKVVCTPGGELAVWPAID